MLTPQFSVRGLLLLVTVCAVACLAPAVAARGHLWALALCVALAGAVIVFAVHAVMLAVTAAVAAVLGRQSKAGDAEQAS